MLTLKDDYRMHLPNTNMMESFANSPDLEKLFDNYWKLYISQFPSEIFQRVNENFYRSTFYNSAAAIYHIYIPGMSSVPILKAKVTWNL